MHSVTTGCTSLMCPRLAQRPGLTGPLRAQSRVTGGTQGQPRCWGWRTEGGSLPLHLSRTALGKPHITIPGQWRTQYPCP